MGHFLRAYAQTEAAADDPTKPIRWVASTEGVKADGFDLKVEDWDLSRFSRHGVILWGHDYMGMRLPIGTGQAAIEGKNLMVDVTYDAGDVFSMEVRRKTRLGMIAGSVSWDRTPEGKNLLLEFSNVPVGLDPDSLPVRQARAWQDMAEQMAHLLDGDTGKPRGSARGAIPPHSTPKAAEDAAWDGPAQMAKCEGKDQLRRVSAWVDDSMDPETKQAYKLPHHNADGQVVWRGVAAAMTRLLQAGTQIPDADRQAVYNHLARHYKQFDKEPPEFRTVAQLAPLGPEEIRGLFLHDEWDIAYGERAQRPVPVTGVWLMAMTDDGGRMHDDIQVLAEIDGEWRVVISEPGFGIVSHIVEPLGMVKAPAWEAPGGRMVLAMARAGAVLSARNLGDLEKAAELITAVIERAKKDTGEDTGRAGGDDGALLRQLSQALAQAQVTITGVAG